MKWCNDNDRFTVTVSDESLPSVSNILLLCGLVNISISGIGGRLHWCIDGRCVQTDGRTVNHGFLRMHSTHFHPTR